MTPLLAAALILGTITGVVGKYKGSSFFIWFFAGTILPGIALLGVILNRFDSNIPRRLRRLVGT